MEKTPLIRYSITRDLFQEASAHIAHEINKQGEEAFNLALSEYGYVKVEEARDIELLRCQRIFEREGRIRALEQLCCDIYAGLVYAVICVEVLLECNEAYQDIKQRVDALRLFEGSE